MVIAEPAFAESAPCLTIERVTDASRWDAYVDAHPRATAYHRWQWRQVFEGPFRQRCEYLAAVRDGALAGVLPLVHFNSWLFGRFVVSLPYVNYGGILADDEPAAQALLEAAAGLARGGGARHVELRHRRQEFTTLPSRRHKVAMELPLCATADVMWQRFDRKVRNQVRKAEKSGLTAVTGRTELLDEFYAVFARNMRDLGTPVYSRDVFACVLAAVGQPASLHVVRLGGQAVAGALSIAFKTGIEVPWASSLKQYLPMCPNNLLYWHVIRFAIERGLTRFDFGRSTPDEGTFHFKRQWGAEPTPLAWEYWLAPGRDVPDQSPKNPRFATAISAWRRLPLAVTNHLGPVIVRAIP